MSSESVRNNKEIIDRVEEVLQNAYRENSAFNDAMDGGSMLDVLSLNPSIGSYQLAPSEALFWTDRKAYFDDLLFWQDNSLQERHREAVDFLKTSSLLPAFHDFTLAVERCRIAPFIGAGMSLPSGFPLWSTALRKQADKIGGVDMVVFDDLLARYDFLGAAQLLWSADSIIVTNEIRTTFAKAAIPGTPLAGPIRLLKRFSHGCVVTTNFDSVIEASLKGEVLDGYMHGLQKGNNFVAKLIKGDRCIMKLHGDADEPESYIYTKEQYDEGYGDPFDFNRPLPRALRQIFVSHSLLFLGCSLEQDKTMSLFEAVKNQQDFAIPDHFAILAEPASGTLKNEKEARLLNLGIRPIWYPNSAHEFVESYLQLAIDVAEGRFKLP